MKICVIDDDQAICRSLQLQLQARDHEVATGLCGGDALRLAADAELVFLDLQLPDISGLRVLEQLLASEDAPAVVMITGRQDMEATITAIQKGASDYIRKPLSMEAVLGVIEKVQARSRRARVKVRALKHQDTGPREIVGRDRQLIGVLKQVARISQSRVGVLIQGESGTGKELVARAIHEASSPGKPFVAVNCASLAPGVWESELFGHEKGAFTGASRQRAGRFEVAEDGTVFLDEIGDMPAPMQAMLLRALQEREFERVGGHEAICLRARVIAATHRDLDQAVDSGDFRADLFHRLKVETVRIPPLRERKGDIPLLVDHLLHRISHALGRRIEGVAERVLLRLQGYEWPGNVRELENVLMRSVSRCDGAVLLDVVLDKPGDEKPSLISLSECERRHIRHILEHVDWNVTRAARILEISPTTVRKKIADYGLKGS